MRIFNSALHCGGFYKDFLSLRLICSKNNFHYSKGFLIDAAIDFLTA